MKKLETPIVDTAMSPVRNRLGIILLCGALEVVGGCKENKSTPVPNPKPVVAPSVAIDAGVKVAPESKGLSYEEWSKSVVLPEFDMDLDKKPLSPDEVKEYFQTSGYPLESIDAFYAHFDSVRSQLDQDFSRAQTPIERASVLQSFIMSLLKAHSALNGRVFQGRVDLAESMGSVTKLLIPHGVHLLNQSTSQTGLYFKMSDIDSIRPFDATIPAKNGKSTVKDSVPVVYIHRTKFFAVRDDLLVGDDLVASHNPEGDYIAVDLDKFEKEHREFPALYNQILAKAGIKGGGIVNSAFSRSDDMKSLLAHEYMHHFAHSSLGLAGSAVQTPIKDAVRVSGSIDLPGYSLPESAYKDIDNTQLAELMGRSAELWFSGSTSQKAAANLIGGNYPYDFAVNMFLTNLGHTDAKISPDLRRAIKVRTGDRRVLNPAAVEAVMVAMTHEDRQKIGKILTLLSVHMATQQKK